MAYSIQNTFRFKTTSSKTNYKIVCKNQNCSLHLYTIAIDGTINIFHIKPFISEHLYFFDLLTGLILELLLFLLMLSLKNSRSNPSAVDIIFNVIFNVVSV